MWKGEQTDMFLTATVINNTLFRCFCMYQSMRSKARGRVWTCFPCEH